MQYLKYHRLVKGFTQAQLAKKAHISQGHYSDIESGRTKPHPEIHKRIADALERPLEEFTAKLYGINPDDMVIRPRGAA